MLEERTIGGLHSFLESTVLSQYTFPGGMAIDLGCGSGALAMRLQKLGMKVVGVDLDAERFKADLPFMALNLSELVSVSNSELSVCTRGGTSGACSVEPLLYSNPLSQCF